MSTGTKKLIFKNKNTEPRSRPIGPRSKPAIIRPCRRCLGGALAHATVEPKEAVTVEPSGPDLGPTPRSHRRSAPKEAIPIAKGSSGARCVAQPSQREAWVHVTEGSSAKKALEPPSWRGGGRRARQSLAWVKPRLEGQLGMELNGEGMADVAGLGVLARPLIPATYEVHPNMEKEREKPPRTGL
jgi:hypothetical protein